MSELKPCEHLNVTVTTARGPYCVDCGALLVSVFFGVERAQPAQAEAVPDVRAEFERARADGAFSPALDCCPTWYATELRFEGWSAAIAAQGAKP